MNTIRVSGLYCVDVAAWSELIQQERIPNLNDTQAPLGPQLQFTHRTAYRDTELDERLSEWSQAQDGVIDASDGEIDRDLVDIGVVQLASLDWDDALNSSVSAGKYKVPSLPQEKFILDGQHFKIEAKPTNTSHETKIEVYSQDLPNAVRPMLCFWIYEKPRRASAQERPSIFNRETLGMWKFGLQYVRIDYIRHQVSLGIQFALRVDKFIQAEATIRQMVLLALIWIRGQLDNPIDLGHVYRSILPDKTTTASKYEVQSRDLIPKLYPFQQRTISWMLDMENQDPQCELYNSLYDESIVPGYFVNILDSDISRCRPTKFSEGYPRLFQGGILAEEMGLGKTVEVIALILANQRPADKMVTNITSAKAIKATLIVTPSTIISQWLAEIEQHAPKLKWFVYQGNKSTEQERRELEYCDVVLTTYDVLRSEIHYARADQSDRKLRGNQSKIRTSWSTLMTFEFWRVCLDEAQMVESTVTAAAEMASMIPRVYSWAVTGTPTGNHKSSMNDLRGLFRFLELHREFDRFTRHSASFHRFIKLYMIRNTKDWVKDELSIPSQIENQIELDFQDVEQYHYNEIREKMTTEMKDILPRLNTPSQQWDDVSKLQSWLLQLRQSCCHPQIGSQNRKKFGDTFQSIPEVLDKMYQQALSQFFHHRRCILAARVRVGLMKEIEKKWDESTEIYNKVLSELNMELDDVKKSIKMARRSESSTSSSEDDHLDCDDETPEDINNARNRLLSWLSLKHQTLFCLASVCLEKKEKSLSDGFYTEAENVRKEIMKPAENLVMKNLQSVKEYHHTLEQELKHLQIGLHYGVSGGLVSWKVINDAKNVCSWLNEQADQLLNYRAFAIKIAFRALHEKDYASEAEIQDLGHRYQDKYREAVSRRRQIISGNREKEIKIVKRSKVLINPDNDKAEENGIIRTGDEDDVSQLSNSEGELEKIPEPDSHMELSEISLKSVVDELRRQSLRWEELPAVELEMCRAKYEEHNKSFSRQNKLLIMLERDLAELSRLWNSRVRFYRILQRLSDDVVIPTVDSVEQELNEIEKEISGHVDTLSSLSSKRRYLEHLIKENSINSASGTVETQISCLICSLVLDDVQVVLITKCGHLFCEPCLFRWLSIKTRCPACNQKCTLGELRKVDKTTSIVNLRDNHSGPRSTLFEFPPLAKLPKVKGSHGSKISLMTRHLLFLLAQSPTLKCIIFSQWDDVLDIVERALNDNTIGYVRLGSTKKQSTYLHKSAKGASLVKLFHEDHSTKVMLLNAKRQSAGLTLVNASHVFLVEPCVNPAIELQAMGRVHRLGQKEQTWVHRYIVKDTVESDIYEINRRKAKSMLDTAISKKGTILKAGHHGEAVLESDLINILTKDMERPGFTKSDIDTNASKRIILDAAATSRNVSTISSDFSMSLNTKCLNESNQEFSNEVDIMESGAVSDNLNVMDKDETQKRPSSTSEMQNKKRKKSIPIRR